MARTDPKRTYATYEGDKMNRLQINIELVEAMGWKKTTKFLLSRAEAGSYRVQDDGVWCLLDGVYVNVVRRFDYRDPVVFVAICKHWGITTQFRQNAAVLCHDDFSVDYVPSDSIEKAAALLVIDLVKRGVK